MEMPVPSQKVCSHGYVCQGFLFCLFFYKFRTVTTVWYFLFFFFFFFIFYVHFCNFVIVNSSLVNVVHKTKYIAYVLWEHFQTC